MRRDGSYTLAIMVNLILYGDIKDKSITSKLCRVLSDYGGVLYFSDTKASRYGNYGNISFNIYECDNVNEIAIPDGIVIFKSKQSGNSAIKLSDTTIVIIESTNCSAISAINGNNNPCISCGMSNNDSVTLSSISDNSATISIQRSITDIKGNVIEPCDITVRLKQFCDGFTLLSIFCLLVISGEINEHKIII